MSLGHQSWKGRHKRWTRRWANDLRQVGPLIAIALCFAISATAIVAAERAPSEPAPIEATQDVVVHAADPSCLDRAADAPRP